MLKSFIFLFLLSSSLLTTALAQINRPENHDRCDAKLKSIGRQLGFSNPTVIYRTPNGRLFRPLEAYLRHQAALNVSPEAKVNDFKKLEMIIFDKSKTNLKDMFAMLEAETEGPPKIPYITANQHLGGKEPHLDFWGMPFSPTLSLNDKCEIDDLAKVEMSCKKKASKECDFVAKLAPARSKEDADHSQTGQRSVPVKPAAAGAPAPPSGKKTSDVKTGR